jgi:hypothetical protein
LEFENIRNRGIAGVLAWGWKRKWMMKREGTCAWNKNEGKEDVRKLRK